MASETPPSAERRPAETTLRCAAENVGELIGPRGATIRRIQEQTGARISVDSKSGRAGGDIADITIVAATDEIVAAARAEVLAIVQPHTAVVCCDAANVGVRPSCCSVLVARDRPTRQP